MLSPTQPRIPSSPLAVLDDIVSEQRQSFTPENLLPAIFAVNIDPEGSLLNGEFRSGLHHIFKLSRSADVGGDSEKLALRAPIYIDNGCDTKISVVRTELRILWTLKDKGFR